MKVQKMLHDDVMALGVTSPGDDLPFLTEGGSAVTQGSFGNSLADRIYWEEEENEG